jgi:hypothetical protein
MIFPEKQLVSVMNFIKELEPKNEMDERIRLEELEILYNADMPDCIIVKHRYMGYRAGNDIDELRFNIFDAEGNRKDVRSVINDPNARWSFYHHCKELYYDGGMLKCK